MNFFAVFRYEEINVNLVEKPDWYLARNAPGQVPSLEWIDPETKETKFIPESLVVCDYLEETKPEVQLYPGDAYAKAKQRILVERFSSVNERSTREKFRVYSYCSCF